MLILKGNLRIILNGSNWSIWYYPFTQVQSAEHIAINQFQMQSFCGQFLLRWSQNEENVHETLTNTKIPFKNVLSLTIESSMYLKFLQKRT